MTSPPQDRAEETGGVTTSPPVVSAAPASSRRLGRVRTFPLVVGLLVAGVSWLVIYPLSRLLYEVFFGGGEFGPNAIGTALRDPALLPALANTGVLILAAGLASLTIGTGLAWATERTDARIGWLTDILPILPLLVPPVALAVGWVFLLAPTGGFLNAAWRYVFGGGVAQGSGPINIYSLGGMVFVTTIYLVPFAYLTMSAAFQNADPALEEASRVSGAGTFRTFLKVTVPSVRSSAATAAVLILLMTVAIVSVPIVIGLPAHIDVLSVLIFRVLFATAPPRLGEAVALGSFMFVAVQAAILFEYFVTRRRRHSTISGRSRAGVRTELGVLRWPVRVVILGYLLIATVAPLIGLIFVSLQPFWTSSINWGTLSLQSYHDLFGVQSALRTGLQNSLFLGVVTATVLMVLAAVLTFYIQGSSGIMPRLVNGISGLPASVPHTVIGIALLVTLASGANGIGGTLRVLFLAYVVVMLPQATRSAGAALSQVGKELWDASSMSGASPLRTFRRILLPLMLTGLIAGWVIVFVQSFGEINTSIFLSGSSNPVVGPVILDVWTNSGTFPQLAALTVVVMAIQTTVVLTVLGLRRRSVRDRNS